MSRDDDPDAPPPDDKCFAWPTRLRPNYDIPDDLYPLDPTFDPDTSHLIFSDGEPVESIYFERTMRFLVQVLYCSWVGPGPGRHWVAHSNVGLFWEPKQTPLVPDVLVAVDVPSFSQRPEMMHQGYMLWKMGKPPDLVVEFVSDLRGGAAGLHQKSYAGLRVPYYVAFDPDNLLGGDAVRAFALRSGIYEEIDPTCFPTLGLGLVLWDGEYQGFRGLFPRWCDRDGKLLPTPEEVKWTWAAHGTHPAGKAGNRAEQEKKRADEEEKRANQAKQRADRLAAKLRELGVDPETLSPG